MSFDKQDFLATVARRAEQRGSNMMPMLRVAAAVGPVMQSLLTGNPAWDRYLTHLQGLIDQAKAARAKALDGIAGPDSWDGTKLMKLKSDILVADAMIEAWTVAMNLPKALIEGSEMAAQEITRIEQHAPAAADGA